MENDTVSDDRRYEIAALEQKLREREQMIDDLLQQLATSEVDELTGLRNRRWLRRWWENLESLSRVDVTVCAVALMDLDRFKEVNDSYGHGAGDQVLCQVGAILMSSGCYVVRTGGDEFLIIVPAGIEPASAMVSIVANVARPMSIRTDASEVMVTIGASVGVTRIVPGRALHAMIGLADAAMYEAKGDPDGPRWRLVANA